MCHSVVQMYYRQSAISYQVMRQSIKKERRETRVVSLLFRFCPDPGDRLGSAPAGDD